MDLNEINSWVNQNLLALLAINMVLNLLVFYLFFATKKRLKRYKYLFKGNEDRNLEEVLVNLSENAHLIQTNINRLEEKVTINQAKEELHLQNWALVRFKAFQNTGGDQSFAFAMLDGAGDGVVLSSLFGREESRVYCKPVERGVSSYPLSDEEKEAIDIALGKIKNK